MLKELRKHYAKITEDWSGSLYAGITLQLNYDEAGVDSSMPGYVAKLRARFNNKTPEKPVNSLYKAKTKVYGAATQDVIADIDSLKLNEKGINIVKQVVVVCLYYARAVDDTILTPLCTIASQQNEVTEDKMQRVIHLLNYLATHADTAIIYHASDMILYIHFDASYLTETKSRSRLRRYHFLGSLSKRGEDILVNGNIFVTTGTYT